MDNSEITDTDTLETSETTSVSTPKSSNKWLKIVLLGIFGLLIAGGLVYVGYWYGSRRAQSVRKLTPVSRPTVIPTLSFPTTTPEVTVSTPPLITTQTKDWQVYIHKKFADREGWQIPWKGFKLYYPRSWRLEENRNTDAPSLSLRLIKKESIEFSIIQAGGSVGWCLFPEDQDNPKAPMFASHYDEYYEIANVSNIVWRLAVSQDREAPWNEYHYLCEKTPSSGGFFHQETTIGYVPIRIPQGDTGSLNETIEMLEKIEILD